MTRAWQTLRERLPTGVELVAVAYADHDAAACPPPHEIFQAAALMGLRTWLVDTFQKDGRTTCDYMDNGSLEAIVTLARAHHSRWVLAGSMQRTIATRLLDSGLVPDYFGVRGDVCDGSRADGLSRDKVHGWLEMLCGSINPTSDGHTRSNRAYTSHSGKL